MHACALLNFTKVNLKQMELRNNLREKITKKERKKKRFVNQNDFSFIVDRKTMISTIVTIYNSRIYITYESTKK